MQVTRPRSLTAENSGATLLFAAECAARQREWEKAGALVRPILDTPNDYGADTFAKAALRLFEAGEFLEAVRAIERAPADRREHPTVRLVYGQLLRKLWVDRP